jgi:hypothetical protein
MPQCAPERGGFTHLTIRLTERGLRYNKGFPIQTPRRISLADKELYKSEYVGSGTFIISKPKRKSHKLRQSRLKGRKAGMRK